MSTCLDDFNESKEEIDSVKEDQIISINMPFKLYLQQVQVIIRRLKNVKAILEAGGMDFKMVDRAERLNGACRELYSLVYTVAAGQSEFRTYLEEAEVLMYDIKEAMLFAFKRHPELLQKISNILNGNTYADMFQDLNDFATLGRNNKELLNEIGYDMANIERAAELSKMLSDLYAQVTIDRSSPPDMIITRNKAFTLLKKAIDDLISQARYILRADKEKVSELVIRPPVRKSAKKVTETEKTAV